MNTLLEASFFFFQMDGSGGERRNLRWRSFWHDSLISLASEASLQELGLEQRDALIYEERKNDHVLKRKVIICSHQVNRV